MKIILIAWFVFGTTSGTSVTAEFDSMESCQKAAQALELAGDKGAGKNVTWRHICTPK